ncbi:MAG: serine/threonine-protein kinase [Gemmatimonadota bacterium]|nr:serine/threonine-protein kinase [Gemmatimonadota bacterium]
MSREALEIARALPSAVTGSSFDRERRPALWSRVRLTMIFGAGIGVLMYVLGRTVFTMPPVLESPLVRIAPEAWLAYPALFIFGSIVTWRDRWSAAWLEGFALAVTVAFVAVDSFLGAAFFPREPRFFTVALILFLPAAMIPWRIGFQAALGAAVVAFHPAAVLLVRAAVPEIDAWYATAGPELMREVLVDQAVGAAVLAGVSVLVTRTLHGMRRQLHAATRIGNYLIERELGSGGMGRVFEARHALIRRPTAVKVMRPETTGSAEALARFEREVQLSATLTHPNTITIFDFGRADPATFYYAMEYLDGLDLKRLVERFGPLPPERAVYLVRQACGSLAEAHARGIVHRDVKPSNIFLTERGGLYDFVKVLDFGLARPVEQAPDARITAAGQVFGTPSFIAPEAITDPETVDRRSDIYCVGAVLFWALTGRPPFAGRTAIEAMADQLRSDPVAPSRATELEVPPALDEAVLRCLAKDRDARFAAMPELLAALDEVGFDTPWDQERARAWWNLHGPEIRREP